MSLVIARSGLLSSITPTSLTPPPQVVAANSMVTNGTTQLALASDGIIGDFDWTISIWFCPNDVTTVQYFFVERSDAANRDNISMQISGGNFTMRMKE